MAAGGGARRGASHRCGGARQLAVALVQLLALPGARAFGEAPKYLIASSPSQQRGAGIIAYMKLPQDGAPATGSEPMRVLVKEGLTSPQGIAVDEYRRYLYVADPTLNKLVRFKLRHDGDALKVGKMEDVARSVEVRAVAVDGLGNILFTEEPSQRIMRVSAEMAEQGNTKAEVLYENSHVEAVTAPGGIAVDNFYAYWLNKADGQRVGSLVRGVQRPARANVTVTVPVRSPSSPVQVLAFNTAKSYGVCIALGNTYYTDEFNNLYGIERSSTFRHNPVTITQNLTAPRGCAFDGQGTVYVADHATNTIYQFASNLPDLVPYQLLLKAAELQNPFGVAVYTKVVV